MDGKLRIWDPDAARMDTSAQMPKGWAPAGSWTGHHGCMGAGLHEGRRLRGGVAATVLALIFSFCGVSDASGSVAVVGTPVHPQLLTCAEEATQFTGTLPRIGAHDIGFGPGYFPQARRLATMNPPNSGRKLN